MDTQSFITTLEKLLAEDDLISVGRDAQELKGKFYDFILEQERKEQVKELEAKEKKEDYSPVTFNEAKDQFKNLFLEFQSKRKKQLELVKILEEENLKQKVSNDVFNGDMKVSNSAKIHHEFRKKNNTGNHPRARLSTADREKLERLAAISGVASSPESTAKDGKDSSADDDEEVSEQSTADMESKVYSEQPIKKRKISLRK